MSGNQDNSKIKSLALYLKKKGSSGKEKKVYTEKIKTLEATYEYEVYSDFISDGKGKELADTITIQSSGTPPQNVPPVINIKDVWNAVVNTKNYVVGGSINDVNGNLATVVWTIISAITVPFIVSADQQSITFDVPDASGEELKFHVVATDSDNAKAEKDITVKIKSEPEPEPIPTGKMFGMFADSDSGSKAEEVTNKLVQENPDTIVFAGDGPYDKEGKTWTQMLDKNGVGQKKPLFSQGNHDGKSSESQQTEDDIEEWYRELITKFPEANLKDLNVPPEDANNPNWDVVGWLQPRIIGDVYLFTMNSEDMDIEFEGRNQYNWVTKTILPEIKTLKAEGKINWAFCVVHKPWFTLKSSHGPEKGTRELFMKLFQDNGVDGLLHGHNHNIQLWQPMFIDASKKVSVLYTYKEGTQVYDWTKPHGLIIHINGAGGHENNGFTEPVTSDVRYANDKDDGYTLFYSDPEKKQFSIVIKNVNGNILHTAIYSKGDGQVEPDPTKPVLDVAFPTQMQVLQQGSIDASLSKNVDSVTVEQTTTQDINLNPDPEKQWKWNFVPPDVTNTRAISNTYSLGFRLEARKDQTVLQRTVNITVTKQVDGGGGEPQFDQNGVKMIYKVPDMNDFDPIVVGGNPSGRGQRYNADHKRKNYMAICYFKTAQGQELIEMKTDGPCHGCGGNPAPVPIGMWYEPHLELSSGKSSLHAEAPHSPRQDFHDLQCDYLVNVEGNINEEWIGYCVLAYTNAIGQRVVEQWVDRHPFDAQGKPVNNWVCTLKATEKGDGKMFPLKAGGQNVTFPRNLDNVINYKHGNGFEAEYRMHGAEGNEHGDPHGTDMKHGRVYTIIPPT